MAWLCKECGCNNVRFNEQCVYCFCKLNVVTPRPSEITESDNFDLLIGKVEIAKIDNFIRSWTLNIDDLIERKVKMSICGKCGESGRTIERNGKQLCENCNPRKMTPQEELYTEFFFDEKPVIRDMTDFELRARREKLSKIALEARARMASVDGEIRERKAKNKKFSDFEVSLQPDALATDAINKVKERQTKISKEEKLINQMMKAGMDRATAEALMSADNVAQRLKNYNVTPSEVSSQVDKPSIKPFGPKESKPMTNPFAKKAEDNVTETTDIMITEENEVIITKEIHHHPIKETEKKPFNPFSKS